MTTSPKFLVGIDLGTTHTVVAYSNIENGIHTDNVEIFEIEQLVAPGEVAAKPLLPSFRYHPAEGELAESDLTLPWQEQLSGELPRVVIGEWARELGSKVDGRLVVSAKSWLSHPQVDRSADILPWGAHEDVAKVSPVHASASYLFHVHQAWNHAHPDAPLAEQDIVITVPASFDEGARSLTLEAAALAGLTQVKLLEEPQAVCYDWYAQNKASADKLLSHLKLLLVCDIGGGTTDLSLIKISSEQQAGLSLTRVGVGDHLMLGGDNVDLALAHTAEQRVNSGKKLSTASLSQLIQQTRKAKELLLSDAAPSSAKVTVLGSGARLIGGAKSCELNREEVHTLALDGFFPQSAVNELPEKNRSAVVEFGLPYAKDPAVSKHIAAFLQHHQQVCQQALGLQATDTAIPDAVLFNGGVFNSPLLSQRALNVLSQWRGDAVSQLDNPHPDLAVAHGAVAYGMARRGAQLKIGGGSARSYFLVVEDLSGDKQGVCLLPKGSEENQEVLLAQRQFALTVGQPVQFHLASTTSDDQFKPGDLVALDDSFISLPPLVVALDKNDQQKNQIQVQLAATLSELGTLQLECVASDNGQRWSVEFQIRKDMAQKRLQQQSPALPAQFDDAIAAIEAVYGSSNKNVDPKAVKRLRNDLEKIIGKRESWDMNVLRALFDGILDGTKRRRRSDSHERVWFNLAGYGLRPGFGHPVDNWRIDQIWPLYQQGLQFNKDTQAWIDWWTFWRRAAGGLSPEQQLRVYKDIRKFLSTQALNSRKTQQEAKQKSYEDMVKLVAALEHLPVETKVEVAQWLLKRLEKSSETPTSWWALGRIASRVPFHGSIHNVINRDLIESWLPQLLKADWRKQQHIAFAAVMMSRKTGDRTRDLEDSTITQVVDKLQSVKAPESWIEMVTHVKELDEAETKRVFGEALPIGIRLLD